MSDEYPKVKECGCSYSPWSDDLPNVMRVDSCHLHNVAQEAFWAPHWEGHEECCDLPPVLKAVEKYGLDDVRAAAPLVQGATPEYVASLVRMAGERA